jgi:colanic acid/amylovoran biosynthesis glycosyltransferase
LVPEKDYSTAFNALVLLDQQSDNLNWDYSVVGGGELEADLKQLATQLGIRDKINFTGALDSQAVQEQYDQADLFLISSVTEVLPTVLLEAVSAGLPCVATAVGAVSEILGEKAYLVPTKDPNKLAEVLIMAIKERGQWESMIREQQQTLKDNYDMELILARLIDYYSA